MRHYLLTTLIACWLLAAGSVSARADPVSDFILGFLLLDLTVTNVAITTFILTTALSTGLSYLAKALTPKPKADISSLPGGTTGKLQTSGVVPRSFIAGESMTAGSLAYANTYSSADVAAAADLVADHYYGNSWAFIAGLGTLKALEAQGNTPNAYLVQVVALSDLAVTALTELWVNNVEATYDPDAVPSFEGIAIPEFNSANQIQAVSDSIPSSGPYTVSIAGAPNIASFVSKVDVYDSTTLASMSEVPAGDEVADTYSFNAATKVYTFSAANAGDGVTIQFNYNLGGGVDHLWVRFYDGTQVAADYALVQLFGSDPNRPYASTRVGSGVAYAVVTSLFDQDLFPGFPAFKFVLQGVKLYDRRSDTSAGGSGSQRWADPSTWAFTANPVVIKENILRGIYYGDQWVYGAQTVSNAQLPFDSWAAAANECDAPVDLVGGGSEPQFVAGGEIRFDVQPADTLDELNKVDNGKLAEIGGTYKVRSGAAGVSVFSLSDDDTLSTEQQTFDPFPSLGRTVNAITATYISQDEGWVPKDAPPLYDAALEAEDGGRRQAAAVQYSFATSGTQVQRLMRAALRDHRAMRQHALAMPPDAFPYEPLDVVTWTSAHNGYVAKYFEIVSADDLPNLNSAWVLKELDPNAYDWVPALNEQPVIAGTIVVARPPSQPLVDWNAVPWTLTSDDGREVAAVKLTWGTGSVDISGVRYQVRLASSGIVFLTRRADYVDGYVIISENLAPNTTYEVRGQLIPLSFRDSSYSDWIVVTTDDVRVTEAALAVELQQTLATVEDAATALDSNARATIEALIAAQRAQDRADTNTTDSVQRLASTVDGNSAARIVAEALIVAQLSDPVAGLATRASATDVTALQVLANDPVRGNFSLADRVTLVETAVNDPSGGVAANYAQVVTLKSQVSDPTTGLIALAALFTSLAATVNDGTRGVSANYISLVALSALINDPVQGNAALSSYVQTVSAMVGDVSAQGQLKFTSSVDDSGALAVIDLYVSATATASFATAGLQMAAFLDALGSAYSQLRLYSSRTQFGIPGVAGGGYVTPFTIGYSNTIQQIVLDSDMIEDAGLTARMMAPGLLGKLTPAAASDQTRTLSAWYNGGAGQPVLSDNAVVSAGSALLIDFQTVFDMAAYEASSWHPLSCTISVNGSTIRTDKIDPPEYWDAGTAQTQPQFKNYPFRMRVEVSGLSAGTATVTVTLKGGSGGGGTNSLTLTAPSLLVEEKFSAVVTDGTAAVTASVAHQTAPSPYTGTATSHTFSAVPFGSAEAFRVAVVVISWYLPGGGVFWPTVTIGGLTAKVQGGTHEGQYFTAMYSVRLPTGTTADVAVNLGVNFTSMNLSPWKVVAFSDQAVQVQATQIFWTSGTETTLPMAFALSAVGQVMTAGAVGDAAVTGYTGGWSGADTPSEREDAASGGTPNTRYAAYDMALTEAVAKTLTLHAANTGPAGSGYVAAVAALWQ